MKRKLLIVLLFGVLYRLSDFAVIKLPKFDNIEFLNSPQLLYSGIPLLLGAGMIFFTGELRFCGLLYCALIVIAEYVITLAQFTMTSSSNAVTLFHKLLWFFSIYGFSSLLLAMLGGLFAVIINRWRTRAA